MQVYFRTLFNCSADCKMRAKLQRFVIYPEPRETNAHLIVLPYHPLKPAKQQVPLVFLFVFLFLCNASLPNSTQVQLALARSPEEETEVIKTKIENFLLNTRK